jgi:hypothetical protein
MSEKGCLNCHFFCAYGISIKSRVPFEETVGSEFRTREGLVEKLKSLSRVMRSPWSVKCSRGKWDAAKIGNRNTAEIIKAIFNPERDTCDCFAESDKHADQDAVKESETKKAEARERRKDRRIATAALIVASIGILIALGSLIVAILAYLKP